ncbi:MAG: ribosome recycling factor [Candidatus Omnitrophota bacterium]
MTVKTVLHKNEENMQKAIDSCLREFASVRTGRATPSLVEGLHIDYYGTPTLLKQLAGISVPDAHLLVIQPWDPTAIPAVEKAILQSNLGITPSCDGKIIRLPLPPLSKERRDELVKLVKKMTEEGRISLRTIRHHAREELEKLEKDKVISEDDKFRAFEDLQKLIDKYIARVEDILKNKEKEILEF